MYMSKVRYIVMALAMGLAACSSDEPEDAVVPETPGEPQVERKQVNILSRAEAGTANPLQQNASESLQAGLFMVNYRDGQPDVLLTANNYVNNQLLTWNGNAWTTAAPIYWFDEETRADFYAYAPYKSSVTDARAMAFSVQADQTSATAFAQSDLLWGCVEGQSPQDESFGLTLSHVLSQLTIWVTADTGFDEGELRAGDVSVTIGGTVTKGTVDLQTGTVSVLRGSAAEDVKAYSNDDLSYTAILLPQQVPFANLIQIDWKGNKYTLQNSFSLEARRQYNLTVKLKKTKSGFDIGIEGWDILPEDFGGTIGG